MTTRIWILALALALAGAGAATAADLDIAVDATQIASQRVHTQLTLAVEPGTLWLAYPQWMPGEHMPSGPLETMIGLRITANGQALTWTRDPINNFALRVDVPAGVHTLQIALESGLPVNAGDFSSGPTADEQAAVISWNQFVLMPKGRDAAQLTTHASVRIPEGWQAHSALASTSTADGALTFEPASLARLIDSPVQIGRHTRLIALPGSTPDASITHAISIAADSEAALALPADFAASYGRLVAEAGALFGSRMYRHYTWLLTLSDHLGHFGLEHHESSDDRTAERALLDAPSRALLSGLLAHEYVHSWNGKYRRPEGLLSPDYQRPMDDSLLWVYEGMTEFWGYVLPVRAGLMDAAGFRDELALVLGNFDTEPGADWRPLADTARTAPRLYAASGSWEADRRGTDFYDGSIFLWLDVDAELRARTQGKASLDEFVRRFYAGTSGEPAVHPYTEADVYAALQAIAPADWHAIIHRHLDSLGTAAMRDSLARAGWTLRYSSEKNSWTDEVEKQHKVTDRRWSLGIVIDERDRGTLLDVVDGRAAASAGAAPGMTLVAVNGRRYSAAVLDEAIAAAQASKQPIELLMENGDFFRTLHVAYSDGMRYPHLVRIDGRADALVAVTAARVPSANPSH